MRKTIIMAAVAALAAAATPASGDAGLMRVGFAKFGAPLSNPDMDGYYEADGILCREILTEPVAPFGCKLRWKPLSAAAEQCSGFGALLEPAIADYTSYTTGVTVRDIPLTGVNGANGAQFYRGHIIDTGGPDGVRVFTIEIRAAQCFLGYTVAFDGTVHYK